MLNIKYAEEQMTKMEHFFRTSTLLAFIAKYGIPTNQ